MSKHRKSWSETEKVTILQHYHAHGIASTSRQFEVSASMNYRWLVELKETTAKPSSNGIYNRLLKENQALKEIVAEKELEIRVKSGRFLWFKQGLPYNFCHIFRLAPPLRRPDG